MIGGKKEGQPEEREREETGAGRMEKWRKNDRRWWKRKRKRRKAEERRRDKKGEDLREEVKRTIGEDIWRV